MKRLLLILSIVFIGQINAQTINTIAGTGTPGYSGDGGQATLAKLFTPGKVVFDAHGNMYIADYGNHRIRKVDASGIITTVAGTGTAGYSGDGSQATSAQLNYPSSITIDSIGTLYICDQFNNRIRKVDTFGVITTIAGNGTQGFSGDNGQATTAELNNPIDITIDKFNNLYFCDTENHRVRKINTSGIITTIVGNGLIGYTGDGGLAINAELNTPEGILVDKLGNLYIGDTHNHSVRMVNTVGNITTIAGNGIQGFSGDGGLATSSELYYPCKLLLDTLGNLFITDANNNRIRMINTSGIINTIAGNGTLGFSGDGGNPILAELNTPIGITFDLACNLIITDYQNNRIRKITNFHAAIKQYINTKDVLIYPNPTSDQFFIEANTTDKLNVDMYDVNGRHVFSANVMDKSNINVSTLDNGSYTMTIKMADRVINKKLVILR